MKKLIFAMAMAVAGVASAGVSFSYQGVLKTATGDNIPEGERNKAIEFRLYASATGAQDVLWGRKVAVHLDGDGLFNVELSDAAGSKISSLNKTNSLDWVLSEHLGKDKPLYIGLTVENSSGEIRPRQKIIHVPSAAFAADVAQAKGDFSVQGIATFNGAVNVASQMTVSGGLTAAGGLTVSKGLTVSDGLTAKGDLNVSGNLTATGGCIVPKGGIIMWSGEARNIPSGWALCDGGNGTPDLRGRFIVGAGDSYSPGDKGGEEKHKLIPGEMPAHTHNIYLSMNARAPDPRLKEIYGALYSPYCAALGSNYLEFWNVPNPVEFRMSGETAWKGGDQSHENRPPYYALCFIMKL